MDSLNFIAKYFRESSFHTPCNRGTPAKGEGRECGYISTHLRKRGAEYEWKRAEKPSLCLSTEIMYWKRRARNPYHAILVQLFLVLFCLLPHLCDSVTDLEPISVCYISTYRDFEKKPPPNKKGWAWAPASLAIEETGWKAHHLTNKREMIEMQFLFLSFSSRLRNQLLGHVSLCQNRAGLQTPQARVNPSCIPVVAYLHEKKPLYVTPVK